MAADIVRLESECDLLEVRARLDGRPAPPARPTLGEDGVVVFHQELEAYLASCGVITATVIEPLPHVARPAASTPSPTVAPVLENAASPNPRLRPLVATNPSKASLTLTQACAQANRLANPVATATSNGPSLNLTDDCIREKRAQEARKKAISDGHPGQAPSSRPENR